MVFDHEKAKGRDDVVLAHLNHHLVTMSLRLLRAEIWSPDTRRKLYRVTARTVSSLALDTPAVIAHARLLILGGDSQRLHEELMTAGGYLREGRLVRMNVGQVQRALAEFNQIPFRLSCSSGYGNVAGAPRSSHASLGSPYEGARHQLA